MLGPATAVEEATVTAQRIEDTLAAQLAIVAANAAQAAIVLPWALIYTATITATAAVALPAVVAWGIAGKRMPWRR